MATNIRNDNFSDIKLPGIKGWSIFDDASAIDPQQLVEAQNVVYDKGFLAPREGKTLYASKPSGESSDPLQMEIVTTSDGVSYLIAIYGASFYVWHEENEEWIKVNQTYTPSETTLKYGHATWNNGRGDDRWYACNGVDNFIRWDLCVTQSSGAQSSGSATLTVDDNTRFPSTGTLVIKGDSGIFTEAYTAKSGTTGFTLTNTLDDDVSDNASVMLMAVEKSGMEVGKIVGKNQRRLFVMNYYGGETTGWYSVQNDPEDFTTGSGVAAASTFVISDGYGEITGFHDFGQFAVIEKEDSIHRIEIVIADDLGSKLDKIQPIVSGDSVGPISQQSTVKVHNTLMYPTKNNGFLSLYPAGTGSDVTVERNTISQDIQPYVTNNINTNDCQGVAFQQKVLWTVAQSGATQNTLGLMYDLQRGAWSSTANIAMKDLATDGETLYYLDSGNGNVYELFTGAYDDDDNPYQVRATLPRFDFGKMSKPKTEDKVYVQGYMTPASDVYIDLLFNEEGILKSQTYRLNKDTEGLIFSDPLTNAAGELIAGQPASGWVITSEIGSLSFFRCYLGIDKSKGFYNIQPIIRQNKQAFFGITGIGMNPEESDVIPMNMVVSPES